MIELNRATDELTKLVEQGHDLLPFKDGWDPSKPAGACPASPLEILTWMKQLNVMFFNEMWRKEVLLNSVIDAVWQEEDDDQAADVTRNAARLWPSSCAEGFIDAYFLEITFANHDYLI